jgi:hypothetical protein
MQILKINLIKISLAFSLLVLMNFSGCSVIGLGIGILNHESTEYRGIYHTELLRELEPGTKIILEFDDGKKIKGKFIAFEEYAEELPSNNNSSNRKVFWEISIKVNEKNYTYLSNEIRAIAEVYKDYNYAVPIGLGIGLAVDVLILLYISSLDLNLAG